MDNKELTERFIEFVTGIGLPVTLKPITGDMLVPGISLENGGLIIDEAQLQYPGDILYAAGRLATMQPDLRPQMTNVLPNDDLYLGNEMSTYPWMYAACLHLNVFPAIAFHAGGYQGRGAEMVESFDRGNYIALPLLQWIGLAYDAQKAHELNQPAYPQMVKWVRE